VLFLIDAQLPPSLAAALRDAGCDAIHIGDLGLLAATDRKIWDETMSRSAVLVTKDRDFPILRAARNEGPVVLWVRVGNTHNRTLIVQILRALPAIIDSVERGEQLSSSPGARGDPLRCTTSWFGEIHG
jgi:predicted nuclease of predicted toxin-antitoxin system